MTTPAPNSLALSSKKASLSSLVFRALIGMSVLAVLIFGGVQTALELLDFQRQTEKATTFTQQTAHQRTERQLKQLKLFLDNRIHMAEQQLDETLMTRVSDAVTQAREISGTHTRLSMAEHKQLIIDALRPIRFNSGRSYFIVMDTAGTMHLFPPNPEAEGKHYSAYAEATPAMPHIKVIAQANSSTEGFFTHPLYVDNQGFPFHQRRWYFQTLPALNWIILAHESLDLFTQNLQSQLIKETEIFNQSPFFKYAIYDGEGEHIGGHNLPTNPPDDSDQHITLALSHWQWRVEALAPPSEIQALVASRQGEISAEIENRLLILCALIALFVVLAAVISKVIERKLSAQLSHFIKDLKRFALDNQPINLHHLQYREFSELAETANAFTAQRAIMVRELERQSQRDPLTDLYNRRYMSELLVLEEARITRNDRFFAVILADIDHFKHINDLYGHEAGDLAIKRVAQALRLAIRKQDQVCRWGGEEFLIMLPDASLESARKVAEKIRRTIAELSIIFRGNRIQCTLTMGVALHARKHELPETIDQADKALYRGKRQGRNQIVTASPLELAEASRALA